MILLLVTLAQSALAVTPTISSFSPGAGVAGTLVTINGANFSSTPASNNVKFNGAPATPTSATTGQLVVPVPAAATTGKITVTVAGVTSPPSATNYIVTPSISSVSPAGGPVGSQVTINGSGFSATAGNNAVSFNNAFAAPTSATSMQLLVNVPAGATTGQLKVIVNGGVQAIAPSNFVVGPLPTVSAFTPSGPVGSSITITGTNFSATIANDAVTVNGVSASITSASTTQLVATVPSGATTGKIKVTVSGALSYTTLTNFTVTAPVLPVCTSAVPQTAIVATNATTQRVYAYGVQNATSVTFPTWWLPGHQADIQWLTGTNAGSGTWYADVPLAQFDTGNPRYGDFKTDVYMSNSGFSNILCGHVFWKWAFPPATVSGISTGSGQIYAPVTIYGGNFSSTLAQDAVTFNGQPAPVTSASATQIIVQVPSGATSGPIVLKVDGLPAAGINAGYFTVASFNYADYTQQVQNQYDKLWPNPCAVNDPKILQVLQSEAFLVRKFDGFGNSLLSQNADGTWRLAAHPLAYTSFGAQIDSTSFFFGEPAGAGRSAFLIGPNLMMTAPHAPKDGAAPFDISQFAVIFGMSPTLVPGSGFQTYVCQFPATDGPPVANFLNIPAANVYFPDTNPQRIINTWTSSTPTHDFEAFYLTQNPNRPYLRLRRSGAAYPGDPAVSMGHPENLTTKISPAIELFGPGSLGSPLMNGVYAMNQSSGSMIYNLAHDYVETVVANPTGFCTHWDPVSQGSSSDKLRLECPAAPFTMDMAVADIATSAGIPAYSLVTAPEGDVVEKIAVGATAVSTYTLTAPTTASGNISWQIVAPTGLPSGAPLITFSPTTTSGTLPLGASYPFSATVGSANQCGRYDETFKVLDNTNGFADSLTHHIEVGLTEFALTPADDFVLQKALPTYNGTSKSYQLTNPRPTPVTVTVSSANWVALSYQQGGAPSAPSPNPITLTLAPASSRGSTATVFVSIDETQAETFPLGVEQVASVAFSNTATSCVVTTSATRSVRFTPGKQEYDGVDPNFPPVFQGTLDETITVPDNFTIGSVAVDFGIYDNPASFMPYDFTYMKIVLISPSGQHLTLWDHNSTPTGNYYSVGFNQVVGDQVGQLHIDDSLAPSPLGTHLSVLQGQSSAGTWTIEVTGNGGGAAFTNWALRFTRQSVSRQYDGADPTFPPAYTGTLHETIPVPDNFLIDALAVDVGIYDYPSSFMVYDFNYLNIVLITPSGQRLTLWNNSGTPTGNYYSTVFNQAVGDLVGELHIDDTLSPSPLGTHLSSLRGQSATGTWALETTGSGGGASFANWTLRFKTQ